MNKIVFQTTGSDPEVFLVKDGEVIPAIGLLGGSKEAPRQLGNGFAVQEDNVMAEYNIPPAANAKDFANSIARGKDLVASLLPKEISLLVAASVEFKPTALATKQAAEFGCSMDYDAWWGGEAGPPHLTNPNMRFSGGHVQVGLSGAAEHSNEQKLVVKMMDLCLGVPAILLDADTERKKTYGTPGRYRPTKFGLGYRSLSNFWIASHSLSEWVFRQTQRAVELANNPPADWDAREFDIYTAMSDNDKILAREIIDHFNIEMP